MDSKLALMMWLDVYNALDEEEEEEEQQILRHFVQPAATLENDLCLLFMMNAADKVIDREEFRHAFSSFQRYAL